MELLAPAGRMENFIAALEAGADAIYLGGKGFNARAHAANFDMDELEEAIRLAHILKVSVYVTVNILIGDSEMKALAAYLRDLERVGVDAIIVQDLAVAKLAQEVAPKLHLHGSTQLTATTLDGVRFYEALGFTRIVLGRELSLEEIRHICKHCKAEIEVFVHGALCVCYSGQCLMSSFIGGRSGNRGACAQPCRLPYELLNGEKESILTKEEAYLLSPKDLNYSEFMKELVEAGVTSFKVEGRMKKVSYVRQVIGAYRHILDTFIVAKTDRSAIESGFNRGFSTNYLEHNIGRSMMTIVAPNNQGKCIGTANTVKGIVTITLTEPIEKGALLKVIPQSGSVVYYELDEQWKKKDDFYYEGKPSEFVHKGNVYLATSGKQQKSRGLQEFTRKYPLYAYIDIGASNSTDTSIRTTANTNTSLTLVLEDGTSVTVYNDFKPKLADHKPTSLEKVSNQLSRMGSTLFTLAAVTIPEGDYLWPASVLNELRRDGIAALEQILINRHNEAWDLLKSDGPHYESITLRPNKEVVALDYPIVSAKVDELDSVKGAIKGGAKKIVFGGDRLQRKPYELSIYKEVSELCKTANVYCTFTTPRVIKDDEVDQYKKTLEAMINANPDSISIHVPQALLWLLEIGYTSHVEADTGLNIFNSVAGRFWQSLGVSSIAPSQEMTLQQLHKLGQSVTIPIETMVHGKTEMMISEYCVIASFAGTGEKRNCPGPCLQDNYYLKDRKGKELPLRTDPYCRMHIMNSYEMDMAAYVPELINKGISILRIDGRQVEGTKLSQIVKQYVQILDGTMEVPMKYTSNVGENITRGHYFRGVL